VGGLDFTTVLNRVEHRTVLDGPGPRLLRTACRSAPQATAWLDSLAA
jgi:hypothetical protein